MRTIAILGAALILAGCHEVPTAEPESIFTDSKALMRKVNNAHLVCSTSLLALGKKLVAAGVTEHPVLARPGVYYMACMHDQGAVF